MLTIEGAGREIDCTYGGFIEINWRLIPANSFAGYRRLFFRMQETEDFLILYNTGRERRCQAYAYVQTEA